MKLLNKFRALILLSSAILFTACQTTSSVDLTKVNFSLETPLFYLQDNRPDKQKTSYDDFDSVGKNSHFGDDRIRPSGPELLKKILQQKGDKKLQNKTIILNDFLVINTNPNISIDDRQLDIASATTVPAGSGLEDPARLVIYGVESSMGKRNVYVRVTGSLEGKEFSSHNSKNFHFGVSEDNIKTMINKTLLDVVSEIKN